MEALHHDQNTKTYTTTILRLESCLRLMHKISRNNNFTLEE